MSGPTGRPGKPDVEVEHAESRWVAACGGTRVDADVLPGGLVWARRRKEPEGAAGDAALASVAAALSGHVRREGLRVLTWERDPDARWNHALLAAGLVEHRRKLYVKRDLTGDLPGGTSFGWLTLAELGEARFLELLDATSQGDPFEDATTRDPEREWRELVEHAGPAFDPVAWRVALVDGESAGVVLPTAWPDGKGDGTLSYMGVLPSHRGRGLGRRLHAAGLRLLAGAGARLYRGSTDVRNAAMARIFERNGCRVTGVQLFLR